MKKWRPNPLTIQLRSLTLKELKKQGTSQHSRQAKQKGFYPHNRYISFEYSFKKEKERLNILQRIIVAEIKERQARKVIKDKINLTFRFS